MIIATDGSGERAAELVGALGEVRRGIAEAAERAGREARSITLVAVTKTFPASDVAVLAALGQLDVGENRDQEARAKVAELGPGEPVVRWHLVGQLQTNKARSVAGYATAVHSVDRARLVRSLAEAVGTGRPPLDVFCQVSLDGDPDRGGVLPEALDELSDEVAARPELRLRGVMAVAPLGADPDRSFARLAELSARVATAHPGATAISAGMSQDYPVAIRHGATHVRIGSALLGRRSPPFG